jgi:hypothetical protein
VVRDWIAERADRVELHFLPGYSPELNPVELLNADTKRHVAQTNPGNKHELAAKARTHLRRRQNQPNRVRAFFGKQEVRYAGGTVAGSGAVVGCGVDGGADLFVGDAGGVAIVVGGDLFVAGGERAQCGVERGCGGA